MQDVEAGEVEKKKEGQTLGFTYHTKETRFLVIGIVDSLGASKQ